MSASNPTSSKVPSCLLRNSRLGVASPATNRSCQASPSASMLTTPKARLLCRSIPGGFADILESTVAPVAEQPGPAGSVGLLIAIGGNPLVIAGDGIGERQLGVVAHEQVQQAVPVIVDPGCAGSPAFRVLDAGAIGCVLESAVAVVAKQRRGGEPGDVEILIAVIVVVGGRRTHAVKSNPPDSRTVRNLLEPALTQIAIERIAHRRRALASGGLASVHQVDVQQSVPVEIEEGRPPAGGFDQEAVRRLAIEVLPGNAGRAGHIGEDRGRASRPASFGPNRRNHGKSSQDPKQQPHPGRGSRCDLAGEGTDAKKGRPPLWTAHGRNY